MVNQKKKPKQAPFHSIGAFEFEKLATIKISNSATDGYVIIDAVQLLPAK